VAATAGAVTPAASRTAARMKLIFRMRRMVVHRTAERLHETV
jgi:hypothetical protein